MLLACAHGALAGLGQGIASIAWRVVWGAGHQLQGRMGWGNNSANGAGPHSDASGDGAAPSASSNGSAGAPPAGNMGGQGKGSDSMYYIASPEFTGGPGNREVHMLPAAPPYCCGVSCDRGLREALVQLLCAEPGRCDMVPVRRACWCAAGGTAPSCWRCCASWTAAAACCPRHALRSARSVPNLQVGTLLPEQQLQGMRRQQTACIRFPGPLWHCGSPGALQCILVSIGQRARHARETICARRAQRWCC